MLAAGTTLGPYKIVAPLGAGGMGEVYRARDTRLGRDVAIKVLSPHLAAAPQVRARFEREARTISQLSHPHICTLHDVGHQDGIDYLVMELLEGETLAHRLERGPLPVAEVLSLGAQIAGALDRAHRLGVVHRDLKPGNVMLTRTGAKLMDFGLARSVTAPIATSESPTMSKPITAEGTIVGTFQYMAPEQLEGKEADARTDIWALGCVLYEMTTGSTAFQGKSQASLIAAIMGAEPAPLSRMAPLSPPALDRLVRSCLAKDPDQRVQTAHDVMLELRWTAEAGSQAEALAPVAAGRGRHTRLAWLSLAFLAGALIGALTARLLLSVSGPPTRVVRFSLPLPTSRQLGSFALSPDGRTLAYVGVEAGTRQIYAHSFDTGVDVPIAGTTDARSPFFSPDGRALGFFVADKMMKVPISGGQPAMVWRLPAVQFADRQNSATWLTDGTILCAAGAAGLWRVAGSGEKASRIAALNPTLGERDFGQPTQVVGHEYVLMPVNGGGAIDPTPLELASLDGRARTTLASDGTRPFYLPTGYVIYGVNGGIVASRFDPVRKRLLEPAIPVADSVGAFSLSASGDLAFVAAGEATESAIVRVEHGGRADTVAVLPPGAWSSLSLSPDARRIACHQQGAGHGCTLWTVDVERGDLTLMSREGGPHAPVWTADGRAVVFSTYRGGRISNLFIQDAEGEGKARDLLRSPLHCDPGSFSKDGRWLAYVESDAVAGLDLRVLDTRTGQSRILRKTNANERHPQISPDGAWFAYASDETGQEEVYVEAFPDGGRRAKVSIDGGGEPLWCEGGRTLLYRAGARVMSVSVIPRSGGLAVAKPTLVLTGSFVHAGTFGPPAYAVSPDGRYFYFLRAAESGPPRAVINVILGWREDFQRRLKGR